MLAAATSVVAYPDLGRAKVGIWRSLWNGKDLQGWTTWVGVPDKSVLGLTLQRHPDGTYAEPLGENKDPRGVYSVVALEGQNVLRISGELFGALTTIESFSNYDLRVKWRWGTAQWAPRATGLRDSGILFHATGEHGASGKSRNWMRSIECQIQEGACGDLWSVGDVHLEVPANSFKDGDKAGLRYSADSEKVAVPVGRDDMEPRVHHGKDAERPGWNVTELMVRHDSAVFKVNGQTVMSCHQARVEQSDKLVPLTSGRLQLQSEGAEIFFSEVKLRPVKVTPPDR